jgi:hypothetical protein
MTISIKDFKNILLELEENKIPLKVKTYSGWSADFLHIIGFIKPKELNPTTSSAHIHGVVLSNETETEGLLISNISTLSAFELKQPYNSLEGNLIYELSNENHHQLQTKSA